MSGKTTRFFSLRGKVLSVSAIRGMNGRNEGEERKGGTVGGEYGEKGTDKGTDGVEGSRLLGRCRS